MEDSLEVAPAFLQGSTAGPNILIHCHTVKEILLALRNLSYRQIITYFILRIQYDIASRK